ncbi:MAG: alkaline phosphatase family protein [Deltaproteobacteria bacterium]|nr:alkaline phosphatase family protein [Deltaproteobacteria bacterium]
MTGRPRAIAGMLAATVAVLAAASVGYMRVRGTHRGHPTATYADHHAGTAHDGPPRLLVIGLDGASLGVMTPMMAAGELPAFRALSARGQHGRLVPLEPVLSPLLWNTVSTGVVPGRHGIERFFARVPGRPMSRAVPVTHRRVPALWNLASQAGRSVAVIGWWTTWPAETVTGALVSQNWTWVHDRIAATHPPRLVDRLEAIASQVVAEGELSKLIHGPPRIPCGPGFPENGVYYEEADALARRERTLCDALRTDLVTVEVAVDLLERESPQLAMVYLRGIDPLSHRYWKASFPDEVRYAIPPTGEELRRYGDAVRAYYRLTDRLVARLVAAMPEANVIVLSDHGFLAEPECGGHSFDHNHLLADLGLLHQDDRGIDYSRSQVVHDIIGMLSSEGTYFVNLRSRAPEGVVEDAGFAAIVEGLAARLRGLKTTRGTPLFETVEVDLSPPAERESPDLRVAPNREVTIDQRLVLGDGTEVPMSRYLVALDVSGTHDRPPTEVPGILFAAGPDVPRRATPLDARLLDVAPTLACLADLPLAVRPDGRAISTLMDEDTRARCARHRVPTVETVANPVAVDGLPIHDRADTGIAEELRGLGYVQ